VLARVDAVMHFAAHAYVGESSKSASISATTSRPRSAAELRAGRRDPPLCVFVELRRVCVPSGFRSRSDVARAGQSLWASKLFFENALEAYGRAYGLRSVRLRIHAAGAADSEDERGEIGELHDRKRNLIPLALAATATDLIANLRPGLPDCGRHLRARLHSRQRSRRCACPSVAISGKKRQRKR